MIGNKRRIVYLMIGMVVMLMTACNLPTTSVPVAQTEVPPTVTLTIESTATPDPPTTTPTLMADDPSELADTQWELDSYGDDQETPAEGAEVTLLFQEDGNAGGTGGCNTYTTEYETRDGIISFSPVISTLMACEDNDVMDLEQEFFTTLNDATAYELASDQLTIRADAGLGTLIFVPYEEETATPTAIPGVLCAIGGPGTTEDWKLCRSLEYGFEFEYPADAEFVDHISNYAWIDLPFTPGTNLSSKYMEAAVTDNADTCTSPLAEGYPPDMIDEETVEIGGDSFLHQAGQDAGAGNIYVWESYSISRGSECISLSFTLRSHHPELEPTPPPEYDPEEESLIFSEIVATFEWLDLPATPTPAATETPAPTPVPERIRFETGETSAVVSGVLAPAESDLYVLRVLDGQTLNAELSFDDGEAILVIWGADGTVLMSDHASATSFNGVVPSTQDYYIMVSGHPDLDTDYELEIDIPPLGSVQPTPQAERIAFDTGETSATVTGSLEDSGSDLYVLYAMEGQHMIIETDFSQGRAILSVWGADGTVLLSDDDEDSEFDDVLPSSQDYYILLEESSGGETDYTMEVTIPPQ